MSDTTLHIFRGATVHTADDAHPIIEGGEVRVQRGQITAVGAASPFVPADAVVHELTGQHLCPGFVDPHTHVGVLPEGFSGESKDINELSAPVTPALRASDGVWPGDVAFWRARSAGVTTLCVLPGSANVVGGQGVALRTTGRDISHMVRRDPVCLKVAFGLNVKLSHGVKRGRAPMTRMGIAAMFRDTFEAALRYEQRQLTDPNQPIDRAQEALVLALRREIPVRAHAARSDDILTAIRLAKEFGLKLVLEHGHEAHLVLDQIVEAKVQVVLGPAFRCCGTSEELHFDFAATRVLDDAGVLVAHMTDHPVVPVGYLSLQAGLAVRAGMNPHRALRTVTAHAAEVLGLGDRIGRIAPGLDADLVVLDGPPLEVASRVLTTYIAGEPVYTHGEQRPVPGGMLR